MSEYQYYKFQVIDRLLTSRKPTLIERHGKAGA